jgi:hypothetical protein
MERALKRLLSGNQGECRYISTVNKDKLHTAHKRQNRCRLIHILEHDLTSAKTVTTKMETRV